MRHTASSDHSPRQGLQCACGIGRRPWLVASLGGLLTGTLLPQAEAATGAECRRSGFTKMVSAEQLEQAAAQQYAKMMQDASRQRALAPAGHPQLVRLQNIARSLIPHARACNAAAARWNWEINLIGSSQINAFCMPGGKIAFFTGIIDKLQLTDDEVAMIMGHEMAHALLEHASEQTGKSAATQGIFEIGASLLGLGDIGRVVGGLGTQLLSLRFSRKDESEADGLGLILGAEGGYNPRAAITLWQKMGSQAGRSPPQWLSTHPANDARIRELQARMPRAEQIYLASRGNRPTGPALARSGEAPVTGP